MKDERENLDDISLDETDLGENEENEVDNVADENIDVKAKTKGGKKFPIKAVIGAVGVIIVIVVIATIFGGGNKKKMTSLNKEITQTVETTEEYVEETKKRNSNLSSSDILKRVRKENGIDENEEVNTDDIDYEDIVDEDATSSETEEEFIDETEEEKYEVILEEEKINYKELAYSGEIEADFTITKIKQEEKTIFSAKQDDESYEIRRVNIKAEGSISGLSGTFEIELPFSEEWKLGDMVKVYYKVGEITSSRLAVIDIIVKDYKKVERKITPAKAKPKTVAQTQQAVAQ